MDILIRIKRLVLHGRYRFTNKAREEMEADELTVDDVLESIMNAQMIAKVMRSRRPGEDRRSGRLYVIKSFNYAGTVICTKGKIGHDAQGDFLYIFISSKIATYGE